MLTPETPGSNSPGVTRSPEGGTAPVSFCLHLWGAGTEAREGAGDNWVPCGRVRALIRRWPVGGPGTGAVAVSGARCLGAWGAWEYSLEAVTHLSHLLPQDLEKPIAIACRMKGGGQPGRGGGNSAEGAPGRRPEPEPKPSQWRPWSGPGLGKVGSHGSRGSFGPRTEQPQVWGGGAGGDTVGCPHPHLLRLWIGAS